MIPGNVKNLDDVMEGDVVTCVWCKEETNIGGMIGENTNQCPRCGNPTLPGMFAGLRSGDEFVCAQGGRWRVMHGRMAECRETDSGFQKFEILPFLPNEIVFPY